ncbi:MAG: hypothetical protein C0510_11240 [Erythrobacter sp.]|nr:hypothetical protein [Erythrobacter sp.]
MINGHEIRSLTGSHVNGAPLAVARPPADDVRPWLSWITVTNLEIPQGQTVHCATLSDQPCLRLMFGASWTADDREGHKVFHPGRKGMTLYFGSQSRIMPVSVSGSFRMITLNFSMGASVLGGPTQGELLDKVIDYDRLVGHGRLTSRVPLAGDPAQWADAIEAEFRVFVDKFGSQPPDSLSSAYERACLLEPDFDLAQFAAAHGVSTRTLERAIKRDFGISPRLAQRRARALDIAASLLGVALPDEEATMGLRYYDQAHQIREIRHFFGMRPGDLVRGAHPVLRITLESRQKRRLEALRQLGDITRLPWRDPGAEPAMSPQSGLQLR